MPALSKERNLLQMLLVWMLDQESSVQSNYSADLGRFAQELDGKFPRAKAEYLRKKLIGEDSYSMFADAQFVHLEAIDNDGWMLPILSIRWNFAAKPIEFRVRVALFLLSRAGSEADTQAIAFRIEAREGMIGVHCYPHAQLIRQWEIGSTRFAIPSPQWLPMSFPAWPMDCSEASPVGLLVAVFVTLYGANFIGRVSAAPFRAQLVPYLKAIRYLQRSS